ncbi:MAG: hypothetical protein DRN88_01240 [Candidatus Hydrothermarchaeota archaeon]|nr:MAG: hypothetical protein DRN88_01240 [Candidatus Hydrothermarchaeota archaeon]
MKKLLRNWGFNMIEGLVQEIKNLREEIKCGSKSAVKRRRPFKCLCGLEAHRDAVGCVNIGLARVAKPPWESLTGLWQAPRF